MLDPVLCMGILQDTVSKEFIVWFFDFLAMKKSPFPLKSQWIKEKRSSEIVCCRHSVLWVQEKQTSRKWQDKRSH